MIAGRKNMIITQTISKFSELIDHVSLDLRQSQFNHDAEELRRLAAIAIDQNLSISIRKDALTQIGMRCHVRWFGDLFLPNLSADDWSGRLDKLSRATKAIDKCIHSLQSASCGDSHSIDHERDH